MVNKEISNHDLAFHNIILANVAYTTRVFVLRDDNCYKFRNKFFKIKFKICIGYVQFQFCQQRR